MTARGKIWRIALGVLAVIALLLLGQILPTRVGVHERAVVEAGRTFRLTTPDPGEYTWNLLDGQPARNETPLVHRYVQFRRGELVELRLSGDLVTGERVQMDQELARIHTPGLNREVRELQAERDALVAELALLRAGGRAEEVTEARRRLELAEAIRAGEQPHLQRMRSLHDQGLVTAAELEVVELLDEARRLEIELARAQLSVIRAPARPEALEAIEAQMGVLDAGLEELEVLLDAYVIRAPFAGTLELGGSTNLLRVYDMDTVYLRIPVRQEARARIQDGAATQFRIARGGTLYEGSIVDIGENAINLNGRQVFWASAAVANPDGALRPGMTGDVEIEATGRGPGLIRSLRDQVMREEP